LNAQQLKELVIEPVLKDMDLYSESAVNLLLGTAAQESKMGYYIKQVKGPACGIYQIEPKTAEWLYDRYEDHYLLAYRNTIHSISEQLVYDLAFQTVVCRLKYYSIKEPLPDDPNDVWKLANYWKKHYNTHIGKGTPEEFVANYRRFVDPKAI